MSLSRTVVISDLHIPFEDEHALELVYALIDYVKPDRLVVAGDALDFYSLSRFDKDPARIASLQGDLNRWRTVATLLGEAAYGAKKDFLPGNHEARLRKYLRKNPELHGLDALRLPNLLELERFGFRYHEKELKLCPGLVVKHGSVVRKHSAYSAKAELEKEKYSISVISGHTHRLGQHYASSRGGTVAAYENGCLCGLDPEYVDDPDWQQGCTIVTELGSNEFAVDTVAFLGSGPQVRAIVFGELLGGNV